MSLPPEIITVRRKRRAGADDGPVNFLRVEETKRQRSGTWLYRRKQPDAQVPDQTTSEIASPSGKPVIHSSRPGDEKIPLGTLNHAVPTTTDAQQPAPAASAGNASPRRFHLSRFGTPERVPSRSGSKRSRLAPALFVERSAKRKRTGDAEQPSGAQGEESSTQDIDMADTVPTQRTQKRPGARSRAPGQSQTTKSPAPPQLPPSLAMRQYDTSAVALSQEMDSWALEHIAHTLASQEEERRKMQQAATTTPSKYRPKVPAKRYAERHPDVASPGRGDGGGDVDMDGDGDSETGDEDYVMETYVRVPAHTLEAPVPPEQLGVLVFDQGSDVEYFYGLEDDSEDEFLEDDEDSNDENHYTADYPEDEVESDDEYGRDDYRYRTGNASDKEEFDDDDEEDEVVKSDDEAGLPGTRLWREQSEIRSRLGLPKLRS